MHINISENQNSPVLAVLGPLKRRIAERKQAHTPVPEVLY